jgi:uncharacterized protein
MRNGIDADRLIRAGKRQGAIFLALFGSHARGDHRPESDVDVLARFAPGKSLLDLVAIEGVLSDSIGKKVDLVTEAALDPLLRESIRAEMVVLLDHEE